MRKIVEGYFAFLKAAIVACLAAMVVLVFGNVVLRYGFNRGITVSEELSRWFFVYLTFLGAIVVMREHGHIGIDALVRILPRAGRRACMALSQLLMLFATGLFLKGSWAQVLVNWHTLAPATGFSLAIVSGVGIIFSVSAALLILYELYCVLADKLRDEELIMVRESEEKDPPA